MNSTPNTLPFRAFLVAVLAPAAAVLASAAVPAPGPQNSRVDLKGYAAVYHVDHASGDDIKGDGSEQHPWASIPYALEAVGTPDASHRVAVLISQGRYAQPTFLLKSHVDLYGGFASPGGARDVIGQASVLDGEYERRIAIGADDARIDGFRIEHARVRGKGAAILCDGVSPTIANCVFTDNRTLIPDPWMPPLLHETANDGGAIMCLNGAAPRIEHNIFYANSTECGRGAALASDRGGAPIVRYNVFANNRSGLDDPLRSSDGGAVSFFGHSRGEFTGNIVSANESLTRNDAGGVFVALWSDPSVSDNVFVANRGGDDAGALFLGGQEHRYDAALDKYPSADRYNVVVERNVFVGNDNTSHNSGAMRVTMETRAHFSGNLVVDNKGGFYLQRSEITADHNTVWQDWRFVEDKPSLGPSRFENNILKGPAGPVEARVSFDHNMAESSVPGGRHIEVKDIFLDDGVTGEITGIHFDPVTSTTTVTTRSPLPAGDYARRPVRLSDGAKDGQWRAIVRASGNEILVWGRIEAVTKAPKHFEILRTFTPRPDAPKDLGARVYSSE